MFSDARSKKIILVSHCILNQNVKIDRCAWYPGVMREVTQTLLDAGLGLLQMPCPELLALGLDRQVDKDKVSTVESEDDRVAGRMNEMQPVLVCRQLAFNLIYQIEEYQRNGFTVLGVLGINGSPTCGVESGWVNGFEKAGQGILIHELTKGLKDHGISLPMRGIKVCEPQHAVSTARKLLGLKKPRSPL